MRRLYISVLILAAGCTTGPADEPAVDLLPKQERPVGAPNQHRLVGAPKQERPVDASNVVGRVQAIKPTPEMLPWKGIPWAKDLPEGIKLMREEKRPMFMWASDDEPLDRC
jgi:hypothetical protein